MPRNYISQDKIDQEFDFLNIDAENTKLYQKLRDQEASSDDISRMARHEMPAGYSLSKYQVKDDQFVVVALCHTTQEVVYYIRVNIWDDVFLNEKPVTQVLLWRTIKAKHRAATRDLAENVFFGYLLENYSVVASDSHQTVQGRTFWETKLSIALERGYHVYRYHRLYCDLTVIESDEQISSNSCDLWGDDEDYQNVLAIISKDEISA